MVFNTFSIIVSSDPKNGAQLLDKRANSFTLNCVSYPIHIPGSAKNCRVKVTQASIPYVSPNIITDINDTFIFFYPDLLTQNEIVIPKGLYGLNDFSAAIQLGLSNLGINPNLFTFYGDQSTQKIIITTNEPCQIDFTQPKNLSKILGFNQAKYPPASLSTAGQNFTAPNEAGFDTLTSYLIQSDIVGTGLPINGSNAQQILAQIPISNVQVGGRLIYDPQQNILINCPELIGYKKTTMRFSLLNQLGENLDMLNQYYSLILTFEYET